MFIVATIMTATACSDPFVDATKRTTPGNNQIQTTEFHTEVTMWYRNDDNGFMGLVSQTPNTDLSKAKIYGVKNGNKVLIQNFPDVTRIEAYTEMYSDYLWANVRNGVLMLYFDGGPSSTPPFPFEIIIEY